MADEVRSGLLGSAGMRCGLVWCGGADALWYGLLRSGKISSVEVWPVWYGPMR